MPLIVICGIPCTGKTTRANEIKRYLEEKCDKSVTLVSENDILKSKGIEKNLLYLDFQKEKEVRGMLKSEVLRILGGESVVILDASNYIKGFRYELYCAAKNIKTNYIVVECIARNETVAEWNFFRSADEKYVQDAIDSVIARNEAPDPQDRWDSPLIRLMPDDKLNGVELFTHLFCRKPPPPNMASQSVSSPGENYVYELDKVTQQIVNEIMEAKKIGLEGKLEGLKVYGKFRIKVLPGDLTPGQIIRYRRQFLSYAKMHPPKSANKNNSDDVAELFSNFLNSIFVESSSS